MPSSVEQLSGTDAVHPGAGRPKALAVSTFFPWPLDHGDALRRLMFIEALAATTDLTVVCLERADTTDEHVAGLRERLAGVDIEVLPLWQAQMERPRARLVRLLRGVLTGRPPLLYQQWNPRLARRVAEISRSADFRLAVLVGSYAGVCADTVRADRVILDTSNVMTASELDAMRTLSTPLARLRAAVMLPMQYLYERRTFARVDRVVVTSDEEGRRLKRFFGDRPTYTLKSANYPQELAPGVDPAGRTLLWLSTFNYPPNWDGLLQFLNAAGPGLLANGWTLRVVGAGAVDAQVEQLRGFPFVDYQGYAESLADACDGVAAAVVPVWAGAGVKLKTLTFMGLGVPLLATPVALEGIAHEAAAWVAETPADFVTGLDRLTPDDLRAAAVRGRDVLDATFSKQSFDEGVARLVRESLG